MSRKNSTGDYRFKSCMFYQNVRLWISGRSLQERDCRLNTNLHSKIAMRVNESSSAGEFHPHALPEPDVNLSIHPALIIQLPSPATLPYPLAPPISG
jgi:hypothetical protein